MIHGIKLTPGYQVFALVKRFWASVRGGLERMSTSEMVVSLWLIAAAEYLAILFFILCGWASEWPTACFALGSLSQIFLSVAWFKFHPSRMSAVTTAMRYPK